MAKRRRRRPYKSRPVGKPDEDVTRPIPDGSDDTVIPAAPAAGIPSTGIPVAPPASPPVQLPGMDALAASQPEDQGYARGGAIPSPMPGYSDYTMMKTDPVARRRYSPRHVAFANGGYVDAMDYIPDRPSRQPPPIAPSQFDAFNMVGRQEPQVNPMLAADQPTGYAKGGPIAAAQVPAYTKPVTPPPSEANAALYADMAALRARTVNPPALQMPALPAVPSSTAPAPQVPAVSSGDGGSYRPPITGTAVTPPSSPYTPSPSPNYHEGMDPWTTPFGQLFDQYARGYGLPAHFAEGGEVPDDSGMSAGPDAAGYLRGDNAMDPQELDAVLQQIAQIDPNQSEDVVNLTAITQAAQSGDMDRAASILAGFRRRFDRLNAHAQGAAAHGDLAVAASLAGKAHSQVPDGMTINYTVAPDGGGVTATVSPSGQTFQMSGPQFHDYLVGPATSFDHILENGLEKNLTIASGGQGQPGAGMTGFAAGGAEPPPGQPQPAGPPSGPPQPAGPPPEEESTGYAEGGDVEDYRDHVQKVGDVVTLPIKPTGPTFRRGEGKPIPLTPENIERVYGPKPSTYGGPRSYQEGGEVEQSYGTYHPVEQDELRRQREEQRRQAEAAQQTSSQDGGPRQTVKSVLDHTRRLYELTGKEDRPFSGANISAARGDLERAIPSTAAETPATPAAETGYYGTEGAAEDKAVGAAARGFDAQRVSPEDRARRAAAGAMDATVAPDSRRSNGSMVAHPVSPQADPIPADTVLTGYTAGQRAAADSTAPVLRAQREQPAAQAAAAGARTDDTPYHYTPETEYQRLVNRTNLNADDANLPPAERTRLDQLRKMESVPGYRAPGTAGIPGEEYTEQGQRLMPKAWRDEYDRQAIAAGSGKYITPGLQGTAPTVNLAKGNEPTVTRKMYTEDGRLVNVQLPHDLNQQSMTAYSEGRTGSPTYYTEPPGQRNPDVRPARGFNEEEHRRGQDARVAGQQAPAQVPPYTRAPRVAGAVPDPGWTLPNGAPSPYPNTMNLSPGTINARGRVTPGAPTYDAQPRQQNYELIPGGNGAVRVPRYSTADQGYYHLMPAEDPSLGQIAVPKNTGTAPGMKEVTKYDIQGNEVPIRIPTYWDSAKVRYENPYGRQSGRELYDRPPQGSTPPSGNARTVGATANTPASAEGTPGYQAPAWRPPRGGEAVGPPPDEDQSPAAKAARMFPGTSGGVATPPGVVTDQRGHKTVVPGAAAPRQAAEIELEKQDTKTNIQTAKNQAAWDREVYKRESIEKIAGGKQAIMQQHYDTIHNDNIQAQIIRHMDANSRMLLQKYGDEIKAGVLTAETPAIRTLMEQVQKRAIEMGVPLPDYRQSAGATTGGGGGGGGATVQTKGAEGGSTAPDGSTKPGHVWTNQWGGGWIKQ